ncbi:uncharacterized protein LOC117650739 [Thrips palmi]|uniref:Uncharacterized protein LOC117650739 n=1 Tax=Thrips palmi TaxID=161013 RepID=A0A6P8ZYM0_THRPL|nr:uncharacterized protein LOC117650739 [Thrips palmi]
MGFKSGRKDSSARPVDDGDELLRQLVSSLENEAPYVYLEKDNHDQGLAQTQNGLPPWFDEERFKRGVETFEKNIFLMFTGKMAGLLTLLAVPTIVKVLVLTKKSEEPVKAFRRYVDTIRHMLFWYRSSLKDPKSLSHESLAVVRGHHLRGAAAARRAGLPGISQLDLVLTQFAFCGIAVVRRKLLHLDASDQDVLDFMHVWRTLGCLIGIQDRFNICQFDYDISATDGVLEEVCTRWLGPALLSPPPEFAQMSHALLEGSWCIMPVLEYSSFLNFTQELIGIPQPQRTEPPNSYSSSLLYLLHIVPSTMNWPIIGKFIRMYHNANMHFSLYMSTYHPLLAWYSFPRNTTTQYKILVPNEA